MREESHLDDMRAAIRGDFERLAERRGGQELMREAEETPEDENDPFALVPSETEEEGAAASGSADLEHKRPWLARVLGL